ncbi:SPRY domain-containing protein [Paraburkholderia sp. UCT31]|uniref:SPRY domain-containing protein n=1 Tax=Paraburkholderia sp. UCT31 TaxID=2615209 RepID=UPI0039768DA0
MAGKSAGKWYWEIRASGVADAYYTYFGVTDTWPPGHNVGGAGGVAYYGNSGSIYNIGVATTANLGHLSQGNTVSVLLDMDNHRVSFERLRTNNPSLTEIK